MKIGNIECYGVIYKITNLVNRKCYIGQSTRKFKERYNYNGLTLIERVFNYHKGRKENGYCYNGNRKSAGKSPDGTKLVGRYLTIIELR